MKYFFDKSLKMSFSDSLGRVKNALKESGFGIVSEIRMDEKLNNNAGSFRPYLIIGACSPEHARQAVLQEENIGVLLPCNVIVHDKGNKTNIAVVNPMVAMQGVQNPALGDMANEVTGMLKTFLEKL